MENGKVKDRLVEIQTNHVIQARRLDITAKEKYMNHTLIIDIAVPDDSRTEKKEREKVKKYQDLARERQRLWKTSPIVN